MNTKTRPIGAWNWPVPEACARWTTWRWVRILPPTNNQAPRPSSCRKPPKWRFFALDDRLITIQRISYGQPGRADLDQISKGHKNNKSMAYQQDFQGPSQMLEGDWKCKDCGKAITKLPFQPDESRLDQLRCRECHSKNRPPARGGFRGGR